jgi:hypothetical protein
VLTSYGIALGAAGAVAAQEPELPAPLRASGVSSFVLGAGCVLLAARQRTRPRAAKAEPREEVFVPLEVMLEPDAEGEIEAVALEPEELAELTAEGEQIAAEQTAAESEAIEPTAVEHTANEHTANEVELRSTIPPQPAPEILASIDVTAEAARLARLETELADERARVDRVTAELAALRRVVVEQRQKSSR